MNAFEEELTRNILPFWINNMQDWEHGGFYGRMGGNEVLHPFANKGAILNARILWTFSCAYRILKRPEYLDMADRAFDYLTRCFLDPQYGGVYWELDYLGNPVNRKKQVYAQGFALYGFSEYYRATGNPQALELSKTFFHLIERCFDHQFGGYVEAYTENWQPIEDMRLSEKDANEKKTMNTHLHILEPYTNLCRIWDDGELRASQKRLIEIFLKHILDKKNFHLHLFFDDEWHVKSDAISYGHDIEASWLLYEAAEVLGEPELMKEVKNVAIQIADAASEGLQEDGSMIYERKDDHIDSERHWWVQAEGVVGFMYAYHLSQNASYKEKAQSLWEYIRKAMVDHEQGEWYWSRLPGGEVNRKDDKAGFWKCPYHNGRMCMEMIEHLYK